MYTDVDSNGAVSLMELSETEIFVLTKALVRYATIPSIRESYRELAKRMALIISQNNGELNTVSSSRQ